MHGQYFVCPEGESLLAHASAKFGAKASSASRLCQMVTVKNASPSPIPAWQINSSGGATGGPLLQLAVYCPSVIAGGR
jgi:hypothetical protein